MTEKERKIAVKKALKLNPNESAIVILKKGDDENFYLPLNVKSIEITRLLAASLLTSVHNTMTEYNLSESEQFSGLEILLSELKNNYKKAYFNKTETPINIKNND